MEPETDRAAANDKREEPEDDKAMKQSPVPGETLPPRRALRERGVGRQRTGAASASDSADTNGATSGSGRVLRDRSTRTIPAWLQSDQSDEDGEEEAIAEPGANRRRKVACPRRKKNASSTASTENTGEEVGDGSSCQDPDQPKKATEAQALPTRRTAARAKGPLARASRGAAKAACKNEPDMDSSTVDAEAKITGKSTAGSEKKEEEAEEDEAMLEDEEEDASFRDDPKDLNYRPQTQRDMEDEELSSDEDVPFTDDLNDQSYNPRDAPKSRRRAPPRQREKKEKVQVAEREEEPRIKVEGGGGGGAESVQEVKLESELGDASQEPRIPRRGRRRKDDKTPRLPKRRKKPPVQYVRCEMEGCGTVLAHPRYLQHHIKYQHLLMKKYVCPHPSCGRLFRLQKQLLRHAKHHTDQRDYICEFCARAFKSSHNLAVHRMIHTGEKPLQCEICGFTCRQKASLNWHMKKHDADASYQFSCSICGKKFEKKDSVVAHKAKSHPEVLIAEALAANAGALITTTPASLMEAVGNPAQGAELTRQAAEPARQAAQVSQAAQGGPAGPPVTQAGSVAQQLGQVSQQVVVMGQDPGLHDVQVPVTIALSSMDSPSPTDALQTHLQMPLQFVQTSPALPSRQQQQQVQQLTLQTSSIVTQHQLQHQTQLQHLQLQSYQQQQQQQTQTQILHMTFQPVSQSQTHIQQIPILATPQQLQTLTTSQQIQTLATPQQLQTLATPQQLQTLATPQQLQTLATPQQIQTLATPQQLETLATPQQLQTLATPQQLQTLATTQQLQTLATTQQLQTLATPQQLQTLATPQQLQTLATPQQLQTLATPQQFQTLTTSQQLQTLATPQQIQTLAAPQQLQTLATPQQLQTHQALPHTSATLGPRLLSQSQDHTSNDGESYVLDGSALVSSASPSLGALQSEETMDEVGGVWEQGEETVVLTEGTEGHMQHTLI